MASGPFVGGFERRKQLDIGEWRRVAPVIRASMLRYDGDDLRMT